MLLNILQGTRYPPTTINSYLAQNVRCTKVEKPCLTMISAFVKGGLLPLLKSSKLMKHRVAKVSEGLALDFFHTNQLRNHPSESGLSLQCGEPSLDFSPPDLSHPPQIRATFSRKLPLNPWFELGAPSRDSNPILYVFLSKHLSSCLALDPAAPLWPQKLQAP